MIVEKKYEHDDTKVKILYISNPINKYCTEEQYMNLKVFEDYNFVDLEQIVGILRTIFAGEEEDYISVTVSFDNDINHVEYNKGKLINYKNRIALDHHSKKSDMMEFSYQIDKGTNFSITDKFNNINDSKIMREMYRCASTEINYLSKLKDVKPIELPKVKVEPSSHKLIKIPN